MAKKARRFEMYNMSPSMLFGKSPKVTIQCPSCRHVFSHRFTMEQSFKGNPKALCPRCSEVVVVPIRAR